VKEKVAESSIKSWYREPIVGFADPKSGAFSLLKKWVHPAHFLPEDLLGDARAVVAFFIPFSKEVVITNADAEGVARMWAVAYIETNRLIDEIYAALEAELARIGTIMKSVQATHQFDKNTLMSRWSHKHVAYLCGLGSFGINRMLITRRGCAGRFGSFVIDQPCTPGAGLEKELCAYKAKGVCGECVKTCPTGALSSEGFDRQRCYQYLLEIDARFDDLDTCDVCGKCAVQRCALFP
jgi:epoxyqueuosine reductase QueG